MEQQLETTEQRTENEPSNKRMRIDDKRDEVAGSAMKPMLHAVLNVIPIITPRPEINTFLPNATEYMAIISIADNHLMINNQRFLTQNPLWHPILTRIYAAILFYIQNLRVMRYMRTLTPDGITFLLQFESNFDYSNLPVPSYFEPAIKSIVSTKSLYNEYGFIGPRLPRLNLTPENSLVFEQPYRSYLPDLVCLYRGYRNVTRQGPANTRRDFDRNLADPTATGDLPIGPGQNQPVVRDARLAPGLKEPIVTGSRTPQAYATLPGLIPLPIHPEEPINNWQDYLFPGFDTNWFSRLLLLMREYCLCWPGSSTLDKFSAFNGEMSLVEIQYITEYTAPPRESDQRIFEDAAQADARIDNLREDVSKIAALGQITAEHNYSYIPDVDNQAALREITHAGPYWNLFPVRMHIETFRAIQGIPEALSVMHRSYSNNSK